MDLNLNKSFNYNKGQRRAIWVLLLVIAVLIYFRFHAKIEISQNNDYEYFTEKIDSFLNSVDSNPVTKSIRKKSTEMPEDVVRLKPFNPNIATYETFIELGLTSQQANTILKYLSSGESFEFKTDLKRIYSITEADYLRLEPYILLPEKVDLVLSNKVITEKKKNIVELNSATHAELLSIKGVGPYISKNIIKYRSMLGGFYSLKQLLEVYGIDTVVYSQIVEYLTINTDSIKHFNINNTSYYDLRKHPYITNEQAFEISNHVKQIGKFRNLKELKLLKSINDSVYEKIYSYFVVQ